MEFTSLRDLLQMLVSGGLSGTLAYWLLHKIPGFDAMYDAVLKRIISIALAGVLAVGAWYIGITLGYWARPEPMAGPWILAIINVFLTGGGVTYIVSQAWHTRDLADRNN